MFKEQKNLLKCKILIQGSYIPIITDSGYKQPLYTALEEEKIYAFDECGSETLVICNT
jgi:hypothetical protein